MRWIDALVLGFVQGITEFLPISSDGHLSVVEKGLAGLSGVPQAPGAKLFFVVMLHLGTLAAILIYYWKTGVEGAKGLLGSAEVAPEFRRLSVIKAGLLAAITVLPAIPVGLFLKKPIEAAFDSLTAAAIGFLVTAFAVGTSLRLKGGGRELAQTTWLDALLIGTAQAVAILPGVSRSGMTITTALALGFSRPWAVGFSLLMAVPAIMGAAVLELKDVDFKTLTPEFLGPMFAGIVMAGVVGYLAIIWLVKLVRSGKMWVFSIYLIALAAAIFAWIAMSGGAADAPNKATADRSKPGVERGEGARNDRRSVAIRLDRPDGRFEETRRESGRNAGNAASCSHLGRVLG